MSENLTYGEQLVRTKFNPSSDTTVDLLKQKSAELINLVNELPNVTSHAKSEAIVNYELACMWAVKAATENK